MIIVWKAGLCLDLTCEIRYDIMLVTRREYDIRRH